MRLLGLLGLLLGGSTLLAWWSPLAWVRWPALLLGLLTLWAYLFLRRSLLPRSGSLHLPGLTAPVNVYQDEHGVPHLEAANLTDLYRAQGYITAAYRLWSMDALRRMAAGRLAEVFGRRFLAWDRHARTLGLHRVAEESFSRYTPEEQALLAAYAAGVNSRITEGALPFPFWLLRYRPEPWHPTDSLMIFRLVQYEMSGGIATAGFQAKLWEAVGTERAAELIWPPPDPTALKALGDLPLPDLDDLLHLLPNWMGEAAAGGSWVVTGRRTRSGLPLLRVAPRLQLRLPAPWFTTHLATGDGLNVAGAAIPGVPGIIMGQNGMVAWGFTPPTARPELALEERHAEQPGLFRYGEGWAPARLVAEPIRVRGDATSLPHEVLISRNGPILAVGASTALAMRWVGLRPAADLRPVWALARSRNWAEAAEALQTVEAPALELLFADRERTVAQWEITPRPRRRYAGDQGIVPGWLPDWAWDGFIPSSALGARINPAEGYLVAGSPSYAATRLTERLAETNRLTAADLHAIAQDRLNLQAQRLLPLLLRTIYKGLGQGPSWGGLTDLEKRCLLLLSEWDRCDEAESPAAALWHHWYSFLLEAIFRPQMGLTLFSQFRATPLHPLIADRLIERVAQGETSAWLAADGDAGLGLLAIQSFRRAVNLMSARQGSVPDRWRWGAEQTITLRHSLAHALSYLAPFLRLGPIPMAGGPATVAANGSHPNRPFVITAIAQWGMGIDLGNPEAAFAFCLPGQSEHPLSPFYANQWRDWLKGELPSLLPRTEKLHQLPLLQLHP
jgi:penicillin amidase